MAPPARLERATTGSEVQRSIQLSYGGPREGDGVRTRDLLIHSQALSPLSYALHAFLILLHSPHHRNPSHWTSPDQNVGPGKIGLDQPILQVSRARC